MAKASQATRKRRNARKVAIQHELRERRNHTVYMTHYAKEAAKAQAGGVRLARILCFIAAKAGGSITLLASDLERLPAGARLREEYDETTDTIVIRSVVPKAEPDTNCITLPDGDCIAEEDCMHAPEGGDRPTPVIEIVPR